MICPDFQMFLIHEMLCSSGSQLGAILPPPLPPRDILSCHNCHGATCTQWVETKNAVTLIIHRITSPKKENYLIRNVYIAMINKALIFSEYMQHCVWYSYIWAFLLCRIITLQIFPISILSKIHFLLCNFVQTVKHFLRSVIFSQANLAWLKEKKIQIQLNVLYFSTISL